MSNPWFMPEKVVTQSAGRTIVEDSAPYLERWGFTDLKPKGDLYLSNPPDGCRETDQGIVDANGNILCVRIRDSEGDWLFVQSE